MDKKLIVSIALVVALVTVTAIIFLPKGMGTTSDPSGLPKYALASARITEAYVYARDNPDALDGVKCYCSCMQVVHNGRIHTRGLVDCFMKENGDYESHGASCQMCVDDTLQVKSLYEQGKIKEEIKNVIDTKHANLTRSR